MLKLKLCLHLIDSLGTSKAQNVLNVFLYLFCLKLYFVHMNKFIDNMYKFSQPSDCRF